MNLNGQNCGFHPQNPTSWGSRTNVRQPLQSIFDLSKCKVFKAIPPDAQQTPLAHIPASFPSYFTNFVGGGVALLPPKLVLWCFAEYR